MVIIASAQTQWKGPRLVAPLLGLGQRSYEVYLTHMFVVFAFFAIFVHYGNPIWSVPLLFVATVNVSAAGGDIAARFFSEPLNRMLRDGPRQLGSVQRFLASQQKGYVLKMPKPRVRFLRPRSGRQTDDKASTAR